MAPILEVVSPFLLGLLLLGAGEAGFVQRPGNFRKPFPDPEKFHSAGGRRMQGGDIDEELMHYEAEDGGYHFDLDIAGHLMQENILDLDQEMAVDGLSCEPAASESELAAMSLRWKDGAVPGVSPGAPALLQERGIILGGAEWSCQLPPAASSSLGADVLDNQEQQQQQQEATLSEGFFVEIVTVDMHATSEKPITQVRVKRASVLGIFQDLHLNFSWFQTPPGGETETRASNATGRQLWSEYSTETTYSLNYDEDANRAAGPLSMGILECSDCYMKATFKTTFGLDVDNFIPTGVRVVQDLTFTANAEARQNPSPTARTVEWTRQYTKDITSINFARMVSIPLAGLLVSGLQINIHPSVGLETILAVDEGFSMVGVFSYAAELQVSATAQWHVEDGFSTDSSATLVNDGWNLPEEVHLPLQLGLSVCLGVRMTVVGAEVTAIYLCPELRVGFALGLDLLGMSDSEFFTPQSPDPNAELCVTDISFETDGNLDLGTEDEPFTNFCLAGVCKSLYPRAGFGGYTEESRCECDGGCGGTSTSWCYVDATCSEKQFEAGGWFSSSYYWAPCNPDKVYFLEQEVCFDIQAEWLEDNHLGVQLLEEDDSLLSWVDDFYTELHEFSIDLPSASLTVDGADLAPASGSSISTSVWFRAATKANPPERRLHPQLVRASSDFPRPLTRRGSSCAESGSLTLGFGLHATFNGVEVAGTYWSTPYTFINAVTTPSYLIGTLGTKQVLCTEGVAVTPSTEGVAVTPSTEGVAVTPSTEGVAVTRSQRVSSDGRRQRLGRWLPLFLLGAASLLSSAL